MTARREEHTHAERRENHECGEHRDTGTEEREKEERNGSPTSLHRGYPWLPPL